jgi:hypothetical protein
VAVVFFCELSFAASGESFAVESISFLQEEKKQLIQPGIGNGNFS